MKLEQLHYFQQAVKYRSISVAAKHNYISQSAFSGAISKLERELGEPLLRRTNTGVEVTPFGEQVLSSVEKIFVAQNEILDAASEMQHKSTVLIHCIPGVHQHILPETVQRLWQEQSDLKLSVCTGESREIASNVSSGYADLGVVAKGNYLHSFRDVAYYPLFQDTYQLYVGRKSRLWESDSVSWQEVLDQRHVGFRNEFRQQNGGIMELFRGGPQPFIAFWTDSMDSLRQMIALSDCVALFPRVMARNDLCLRQGQIRAVPIWDRDAGFEVGYLESVKFHLAHPAKEVLRVLKETVAAM